MKKEVICLITTIDNNQLLERALRSVRNQSMLVDKIYIASETNIDVDVDKVFVNPYGKGLARNTMQALVRISMLHDNPLVITLDNDDEWKGNYVEEVVKANNKGYNFIGAGIEAFDNDVLVETSIPKQDSDYKFYLKDNDGLQGSNKAFELNLALESGGMPKNINSGTDRTFNINLLRHPECKKFIIEKHLVKYHKDSNRSRITNSKNKEIELRKFYQHFDNLIDDKDVTDINERHCKLHGIKEVITWR